MPSQRYDMFRESALSIAVFLLDIGVPPEWDSSTTLSDSLPLSCSAMPVAGGWKQNSGYKLDLKKCGVVMQGQEWPNMQESIAGLRVCRKIKYLGTWLGQATVMKQFQGPLAKLQAKAQFLATLPITEAQKVQALHLWA